MIDYTAVLIGAVTSLIVIGTYYYFLIKSYKKKIDNMFESVLEDFKRDIKR